MIKSTLKKKLLDVAYEGFGCNFTCGLYSIHNPLVHFFLFIGNLMAHVDLEIS